MGKAPYFLSDQFRSFAAERRFAIELAPKPDEKLLEQAKNELHQKFGWPTQGEQKLAALFFA
jgi:hypothetical protein